VLHHVVTQDEFVDGYALCGELKRNKLLECATTSSAKFGNEAPEKPTCCSIFRFLFGSCDCDFSFCTLRLGDFEQRTVFHSYLSNQHLIYFETFREPCRCMTFSGIIGCLILVKVPSQAKRKCLHYTKPRTIVSCNIFKTTWSCFASNVARRGASIAVQVDTEEVYGT